MSSFRSAAVSLVLAALALAAFACRTRSESPGAAAGRARAELERRGPPYAAAELDPLLDALGAVPGPAPRLELALALVARRSERAGFDAAEALAVAWGLAPRASGSRARPWRAGTVHFADDTSRPISASVYSLPADLVTADEARSFLAAARAHSPARTRLVLTDLDLDDAAATDPNLHLLPPFGIPLSPWPRDPFLFGRRADGGVELVVRSIVHPGREADAYLARILLQQLPATLDAAWGEPVWSEAPVPFHAGQWLVEADRVWLTIHSVEPLVLEQLGIERVPVKSFREPGGVARYVGEVERAAARLGEFLGRPAELVHALPRTDDLASAAAAMNTLGGGAGFDLDSLVTLPPAEGKRGVAFVASLEQGDALLAASADDELARMAARLGLVERAPPALRARLLAGHASSRGVALTRFLEQVAHGLAADGFRVERLPLVLVSTTLLPEAQRSWLPEFLLGWQNVVFDRAADRCRAEGFEGLFSAGDERARDAFAAAGCPLTLLPALRASLVGGGGYRCASNHLRD